MYKQYESCKGQKLVCLRLHFWQQCNPRCLSHMWYSRVEIKYCSVTYFDHVSAFKALYLRPSRTGQDSILCVNNAPTTHCISELKITAGHWPLSVQLSTMASQNLTMFASNCIDGQSKFQLGQPNQNPYF